MDPTTWRWARYHGTEPRRLVNVVVFGPPGRVVLFNHRARRWARDERALDRLVAEDRLSGTTGLEETDRWGAESAARELGLTLPSDQEIQALMSDA